MTLQRTLLTTAAASVLLGGLGLVGLATFNPAQADTLLAQQSSPGQGNSQNQGQGRGQGQGQGHGQGHGQGQGGGQGQGQGRGQGNCQGQGQRGGHLTEAAAQLGVTEEALKAALGMPAERPQRPDLAAAAAQLGTTEDELRESMRNVMQEMHQNREQGQGMQGGPPDFTALAQQYGVSEAEFRQILGIPDRPNLAEAAAELGVTEEALQEALRSAHGGRGPGGMM